MTDSLREEAERAMREEAEPYDCIGIEKAVSVAVALVERERREWGHVAMCECEGAAYVDDCLYPATHDKRCAPLPGEETR